MAAYLLECGSVHGTRGRAVKVITFSSEADFKQVDWEGKGVQLAMECAEKFLKVAELRRGARGRERAA